MTSYQVVSVHLSDEQNETLNSSDVDKSKIAAMLHNHISSEYDLRSSAGIDSLEEAQRAALWGSDFTSSGANSVPVVIHIRGTKVLGYSWYPDSKLDWVFHKLARPVKTGSFFRRIMRLAGSTKGLDGNAIRKRFKSGESVHSIADSLNVSDSAIQYHLDGVVPNSPGGLQEAGPSQESHSDLPHFDENYSYEDFIDESLDSPNENSSAGDDIDIYDPGVWGEFADPEYQVDDSSESGFTEDGKLIVGPDHSYQKEFYKESHKVPDVSKDVVSAALAEMKEKVDSVRERHGSGEEATRLEREINETYHKELFGCNDEKDHEGKSHSFDEHWCESHQAYHANNEDGEDKLDFGTFHASRHNRAYTNWDEEYDRIKKEASSKIGEVHRGVTVHLPDEVNKALFGKAAHEEYGPLDRYDHEHETPDYKRMAAEAILGHFKGENLGMHWSTKKTVSEAFIQSNMSYKKDESGRVHHPTHIIFHAGMPDKDLIEVEGYTLAKHGVYSHGHEIGEYEVPHKRGADINIVGVSWKHPDGDWYHYGETKRRGEMSTDKMEGIDNQHMAKALMQKHSTMIAIHPPAGALNHLLPKRKAEDPSSLHLTLCCIEDGHDPGHLAELPDVVEMWAENLDPVELQVGGVGTFVNDDKHVLWASVDHPDLHRLHESLTMFLEEHGYRIKQDYGFTPHITLGFDNTHYRFLPKLDRKLPFTAHDVMVHVGDYPGGEQEVHQVYFGGNSEEA